MNESHIPHNEQWKVIPICPDCAVSNFGRIKRLTDAGRFKSGYIFNGSLHKDGYRYVHLKNKNYFIHRLVMLAFVGECPDNMEVNHKNGIKHDNRLENLEYVTRHQNMRHAFINGLNPSAKLTESDIRKIRSISGQMTQIEIGARFGVDHCTINDIIRRKTWKYIDDGIDEELS
jgi:hypothetical protein